MCVNKRMIKRCGLAALPGLAALGQARAGGQATGSDVTFAGFLIFDYDFITKYNASQQKEEDFNPDFAVDVVARRFLQDEFAEIAYEIQNNISISLKEAFKDT
ncbi:MAG: hypothetical protein V3V90_05750 [Thermodesulfobacteriota bacterium]